MAEENGKKYTAGVSADKHKEGDAVKSDDHVEKVKKSYQPFLDCLRMLKEEKKRCAVELHTGPDADSIAMGALVQYAGEKLDLSIDITHGGRIGYENRRMAKLLEVKLTQYTLDADCPVKPENYDAIILLDNYGSTSLWGKAKKLPKEKVVGVIDHHGLDKILDFPNMVVEDRRPVGAGSSIFAEYLSQGLLEELGIEKDKMKDDPEIIQLTTLLMAGIRQDTNGLLERVKRLDDDANAYLRNFANRELIANIENPKLPLDGIDFLGNAIKSRVLKDGILTAKVGRITEDEHDEIAKISDLFLSRRGVEFAYVLGIQPGFFDVCFRYDDVSLHIDEELEKLLPHLPDGKGGGKDGAGGIQIDNPLHDSYVWTIVSDDVKRQIEELLADEILNRLIKNKANNS